jgi:signal transduction histidine kinase
MVVADDGPGIPEQELAAIRKGTELPLEHGSGLGLWMVHWIVTRHDGTIDIAVSETGTTVSITLPHGPVKDRSERESSADERG